MKQIKCQVKIRHYSRSAKSSGQFNISDPPFTGWSVNFPRRQNGNTSKMLDDAFVYTSCHRDWWIQQESPQGYEGNQEKKGSPEGKRARKAREAFTTFGWSVLKLVLISWKSLDRISSRLTHTRWLSRLASIKISEHRKFNSHARMFVHL